MYGTVLMFVPLLFTVPQDEMWILGLTMVFMAFLIIPLVRINYYEFRDEYLFMRMGYIFSKIKYDDVKEVTSFDGWNTTSSMALSREKVKITVHGKSKFLGTTYVSPEDRERFILEMKRYCRNLDELKSDY